MQLQRMAADGCHRHVRMARMKFLNNSNNQRWGLSTIMFIFIATAIVGSVHAFQFHMGIRTRTATSSSRRMVWTTEKQDKIRAIRSWPLSAVSGSSSVIERSAPANVIGENAALSSADDGRAHNGEMASYTAATEVGRSSSRSSMAGWSGLDLPYESAMDALRAYHRLHGDLAIPRRYVVPPTKEFPTQWHNAPLASTVYNMKWWSRHVKSKPDRVHQLNCLSFIWERLQPEWNLVLEALVTFRQLYGHLRVPPSFVVPEDGVIVGNDSNNEAPSSWPVATWGIKLGNSVYRMRTRSDFLRDEYTTASRRDQLDNLGFIWDVNDYRYQRFYTAVNIFAHHQNRCRQDLRRDSDTPNESSYHRRSSDRLLRIPSSYVVPSTPFFDPPFSHIPNPYPVELHEYPLGARVTAVRQKSLYIKNHPERKLELEELGLRCGVGNARLGWLEVVHAATIYSRLNNEGHTDQEEEEDNGAGGADKGQKQLQLDVPVGFVVPEAPLGEWDGGSWPWPEQLWGLRLGQRLKDVRLKGAYLTNPKTTESRKAQLDAMGFVWKPKRGRKRSRTKRGGQRVTSTTTTISEEEKGDHHKNIVDHST